MPEAASLPWHDDLMVAQLRLIAQSAADVAGFGLAQIVVADEDGRTYVAARQGEFADRDHRPVEEMAERYPLLDHDGRVIGQLSFDHPAAGDRPSSQRREELERYAGQAGDAILLALERHRAAEEVRHAATVRDLVRSTMALLADGVDLETALGRVADGMVAHFGLAGLWFMVNGEARHRLPDVRRGHVPERDVVPTDDEQGVRLWERQGVALLTRDQQVNLHDADERIVRAARAFLETAGYDSLASAPLGTESQHFGPIRVWRAVGAPRWTEGELNALGEIGYEVGQVLEAALIDQHDRELVEDLRALNAYKSDMVATVSHELKNPLAALLTNLELLDHPHPSDDERSRVLGAIERATQRMSRIVDDLQLLSTGQVSGHAPIDLARLLRDVCDAAGDAAAMRGQRLTLRTPAGPVTVVGDATELDRVAMNLVSNAIKYSPTGTSIRVRLQRVTGDAVLSVADEGIGISLEDQQRIFSEFFRSTDPRALAEPGTGLGLAIVHRIVERHRGTVEVESEPGQGSTFRVRVPLGATDVSL